MTNTTKTITNNVWTHGSCVQRIIGPGLWTHEPCVPTKIGSIFWIPNSCVQASAAQNDSAYNSRKSPRAVFHDYSGGDYFVTICTEDKTHYFGKIRNGEMFQTEIGKYCHQQIEGLPKHYPYVEVPLFVVMPNHIHAIIRINNPESRTHGPCVPTVRTVLSVVVGGFKRAVTMFARRNNIEFGWQSRYHDHIIRGIHDGNRIAEYIETNVARWDSDCFYK